MNFIFDIDGTICNNGRYIDPVIEKTIIALSMEKNVIFASARPIRDMLPLMDRALHQHLLIGCNGGVYYQNGNFGKTRHFDKEQIASALQFLTENNVPYVLDGDWFFSISKKAHPFHEYIRSLSNFEKKQDQLIAMGVTKLLVLDMSFADSVRKYFEYNQISYSLNQHKESIAFN